MSYSILFHIPKSVEADSALGSKVRPYKLINAFKSIGCDIEVVAGNSLERRKKISNVVRQIKKGNRYDFMYSESSNAPIPVSDDHHLPLFPFMDYLFFKEVKKYKINSGLYYRDVFWKFPVFKRELSLPVRLLTLPLYKMDWKIYSRYMNHLFLPSRSMSKYLHTQWPEERLSVLPPGCDIIECDKHDNVIENTLTCFYVGGILPPVYDLKGMFDAFSGLEGVRLVLCCRRDEWLRMKEYYGDQYTNIEIIHESNQGLAKYYNKADLFISTWGKDPYMEIAMPIKIFESLGYGLPILITEGSEAAKFISDNDIGWVIKDTSVLREMLIYLKNNRNEISMKRSTVNKTRSQHTWIERAKQIISTLAPSK